MIQASNAFSRFIFDLYLIRFTYFLMKYFLLYVAILSSAFSSDMDGLEVENYLLGTEFYDEFITEIIGVYVLYDFPPRIHEDVVEQTKLLKQYLYLKDNPNAFKSRRVLSKAQIMDAMLEIRNKNYRGEYRKFRNLTSDIRKLENKLLKIDFRDDPFQVNAYLEDLGAEVKLLKSKYSNNNKYGEQVIEEFTNKYYEPLLEHYDNYTNYDDYVKRRSGKGDFRNKAISRLSVGEYGLRWNYFKEKKYDFLNNYFDAKKPEMKALDKSKMFSVTYDLTNWIGEPYFVLRSKMFNHDWYFLIDANYQSGRHEFSLIKM
jgi:hypothetical protein